MKKEIDLGLATWTFLEPETQTWLTAQALLHAGSNTLEIRFSNVMDYLKTHRTEFKVEESNDPVGGRYRVRKQQCQFGWDWGPRFVTAGVWRPAQIEAWSRNRVVSARLTQQHATDGRVSLLIEPSLAHADAQARFSVAVSLDGRNVAEVRSVVAAELTSEIENPQLWWPAGQGAQPLYSVNIELLNAQNAAIDTWQGRIGLRTKKAPRMMDLRWSQVEVSVQPAGPDCRNFHLSSSAFVHAVSLEFAPEGINLSDNAFDLYPGEARVVRVERIVGCCAAPTPTKANLLQLDREIPSCDIYSH